MDPPVPVGDQGLSARGLHPLPEPRVHSSTRVPSACVACSVVENTSRGAGGREWARSAWLLSFRNHLGYAGAAAVTAHDGSHGDVGPLIETHAVGVFSEGGTPRVYTHERTADAGV